MAATPNMLPDPGSLREQCRGAYERGDPTAALLAEHAWMEEALLALADAPGGEARRFREAFEALAGVLEAHIRTEEDDYFPALRKAYGALGRDDSVIDDMLGEHDGIALRRQAVESAADQPAREQALRGFSHALVVHFENEEELVLRDGAEVLRAEGT